MFNTSQTNYTNHSRGILQVYSEIRSKAIYPSPLSLQGAPTAGSWEIIGRSLSGATVDSTYKNFIVQVIGEKEGTKFYNFLLELEEVKEKIEIYLATNRNCFIRAKEKIDGVPTVWDWKQVAIDLMYGPMNHNQLIEKTLGKYHADKFLCWYRGAELNSVPKQKIF